MALLKGKNVLLVKALGDQVLKPVTITENGEHLPGEGIDGFSKVFVNVPSDEPVTEEKTITENGEYTPGEGIDGFSKVLVNVPSAEPALLELTVTENGEYFPPDTEILHADGFSKVIVNVSTGSQYPSAEGVYF